MMPALPLHSPPRLPRVPLILLAFTAALAGAFTTGCGSASSNSGPPPLSGNTSVTVLLSSTANDQLSEFDMDFVSVTLSNKAGKTVALPTPQLGCLYLSCRHDWKLRVQLRDDQPLRQPYARLLFLPQHTNPGNRELACTDHDHGHRHGSYFGFASVAIGEFSQHLLYRRHRTFFNHANVQSQANNRFLPAHKRRQRQRGKP